MRTLWQSPKKMLVLGFIALAIGVAARVVSGKYWVTLTVGIAMTTLGAYRVL